jgi:hypothetical protein
MWGESECPQRRLVCPPGLPDAAKGLIRSSHLPSIVEGRQPAESALADRPENYER